MYSPFLIWLFYNYLKKYASNTLTSGIANSCQFSSLGASAIGAKVTGYVSVSATEAALQTAVATKGPIAVGILVTNNFFSYKSG